MMRFAKSWLALLLAFALVFGLAACGGAGSSTNDNGSNSTSEPSDDGKWMDAPGANGNPDWRLPKYEFKSDTVTLLCHYDMPQPDPKYPNAFRDIYKLKYTTVVVPPEEKINKFVSMVMSGDAPDILINEFLPSLVNKGYLQPWDPYIDFNIGIWKDLKSSIDNLMFKNAHYTIGTQQARWDMVWYNKEIFEENGVKTPKEYYEEGNWTWDTFREIAKALTIDADSNGEPEIWGAAINTVNAFVYATGKELVSLNPDGTVSNNIKSPEIARAVQFYTDLCIKDKVVYQGNDADSLFSAGQIAMVFDGAWKRSIWFDMIKADKLFFVPYPKDPQADKYYVLENFGSESLGKDCKNPEGAAALESAGRYNILNTDAMPKLSDEEKNADLMEKSNWTLEMENWLWDEFYKDDKVPVLSTWITFDLGKYWGDIWFRPKQGEPWATIAEELAPKIDEDIARVMEG